MGGALFCHTQGNPQLILLRCEVSHHLTVLTLLSL